MEMYVMFVQRKSLATMVFLSRKSRATSCKKRVGLSMSLREYRLIRELNFHTDRFESHSRLSNEQFCFPVVSSWSKHHKNADQLQEARLSD